MMDCDQTCHNPFTYLPCEGQFKQALKGDAIAEPTKEVLEQVSLSVYRGVDIPKSKKVQLISLGISNLVGNLVGF